MKLSQAAVYAVQALAYLTVQKPNAFTCVGEMKPTNHATGNYLRRVLHRLVRAGILQSSIASRDGGYRIVRPVSHISLLEIIEAVDEPIQVEVPDVVDHSKPCELTEQLAQIFGEVTKRERKMLAAITLASLVGEK